jgi:hypothetical protein
MNDRRGYVECALCDCEGEPSDGRFLVVPMPWDAEVNICRDCAQRVANAIEEMTP